MQGYEFIFGMDPMPLFGRAFDVFSVFSGVSGFVISAVCYVLWSLGMYAIAARRGIRCPWLAWIPVARMWLLGCISDQYQYVVRGRNRSKRKSLLILEIVRLLSVVALIISGLGTIGLFLTQDGPGAVTMGLASIVSCLVIGGLAVAIAVIRFMALYDIYTSCCPSCNALFLVLSILFRATEPFFLFFNRNRDEGMPPRKQPEYQNPGQPRQDPWNEEE